METSPTLKCPTPILLSGYVAGTLQETDADRLSEHIDECPRCQQRIDKMVQDADSLLLAIRNDDEIRRGASTSTDGKLAKLIDDAAKLNPGAKPAKSEPILKPRLPHVDLETFIDCMRRSKLFESNEVDKLIEEIQPESSSQFAKELIQRKKATSFQAGILLRGRYKGLVLGNYVVLEKLGKGGMGHVFKARHRKMGRIVSLKILHAATGQNKPELLERFRREAKAIAALSHPNIVVAHDADESIGLHFLVMEFISGSDLARHVAEHGPMDTRQAAEYVQQVARALDYAHEMGVVHRDIKPHNLLLDDSGTIKILDMGLARFDSFMSDSPDAITNSLAMTTTGVVIGTVDYMAPEQALNSRLADNRSDIYSLGCTLHYLVTGRPVFEGQTVMEKLVAHRENAVPSLSEVDGELPPGLDAIFRRMIAKDADDRYANMKELANDLQSFLEGSTPSALRILPTLRTRKKIQRFLTGRLASSIASSLVVGVITWNIATSKDVPPDGSQTIENKEAQPVEIVSTVAEKGESANGQANLQSEPPLMPFPKAHPNVLANGGPGRALLVLPYQWFYENDYLQVKEALDERGVEIITASSELGKARPKHGKVKPVSVDITLDQFNVDDYDMVVFIGGNTNEFTHKNPNVHELAKNMVEASLDRPRVLAGLENGYDPLREAMGEHACGKDCDYREMHQMQVGFPKQHRIRIVEAGSAKNARALVSMTFDELLAETKWSEG